MTLAFSSVEFLHRLVLHGLCCLENACTRYLSVFSWCGRLIVSEKCTNNIYGQCDIQFFILINILIFQVPYQLPCAKITLMFV
jgi:hypothetical protein